MSLILMKQTVVVLDTEKKQCRALCDLLEERKYRAIPIHSLKNLKNYFQESSCQAVIVDLDTVPIDNRMVRELSQLHPNAYFFCISDQRFHPELKDAIYNHFFACLYKPVDPDELFYLLNCIHENGVESCFPPKG
jgi:DNA-binding NtrC family response regulator